MRAYVTHKTLALKAQNADVPEPRMDGELEVKKHSIQSMLGCALLAAGCLLAGAAAAGPAERVANALGACTWDDKLVATPVNKLPEAFKLRALQMANGVAQVSVVEGFRLSLAEPGKEIFANIKVEQSEPDKFEADRDAIVGNLRWILSTSKDMETPEPLLVSRNGFEGPMINRAAITGSTLALIDLFHEKQRLVLTIYLENAPPDKRSFATKEEWNGIRDRFFVALAGCAAKALEGMPAPTTAPPATATSAGAVTSSITTLAPPASPAAATAATATASPAAAEASMSRGGTVAPAPGQSVAPPSANPSTAPSRAP